MVKHRKQTEHCKTTAKVIGNNMVVLSECPIGKGTPVSKAVVAKSGKVAKTYTKIPTKTVTGKKHIKHRKVIPAECKGRNKYEIKNCVKAACGALSPDKKATCLKKARIKA